MSALLEVRGLAKDFPLRRGILDVLRRRRDGGRPRSLRAVGGVDLEVGRGECLALVGESGSGKTTLARCAVRLVEPTTGAVRFDGEDVLALRPAALRRWRRQVQMVFQDPYGSLDPYQRVGAALAEPLVIHRLGDRASRRRRVDELLAMVELPADTARRHPHEFSGGQRQRIAIARALATNPRLLVADEPVSALDVSVRAQIINLLVRLQRRFDLALLFIAHDLALVEHVADRVAVMFLGHIVEKAPRDALFTRPQHPYTVSLLAAVPRVRGAGEATERNAGRPAAPPSDGATGVAARADRAPSGARPMGCPFHPRCPLARSRCVAEAPRLVERRPDHFVACHYPGELTHELDQDLEQFRP